MLSERLEKLMDNYLKADKGSIDKVELRDLICMKLMKTLSQPGEPVGLLAAQSIGEPSTQVQNNFQKKKTRERHGFNKTNFCSFADDTEHLPFCWSW